jgi:type IV pilus assembly protein PilA
MNCKLKIHKEEIKLMNSKKKGFTLIELIVVIAILGILAAVLIPKFTGFQDKARTTQVLVEAKQIATAADGLLAEGKTTYTAAGPASATVLADSEILAIAGSDISSKVTAGTAVLASGNISTGRFTFAYEILLNGKYYKAVRNSDGTFTTSFSNVATI